MRPAKKKVALLLSSVILAGLFSACSKGADSPSSSSSPHAPNESTGVVGYNGEPVTLKILVAMDDGEFDRSFKQPVESKYPNIKLELADAETSPKGMQELFAKGDAADIYVYNNPSGYKELDVLEPLDPYIKKTNYDLSAFQDGTIDILRQLDPDGKGQLYGWPLQGHRKALFYNKDIFDKFGVPYPKDGMTWDEILDTAKKLTGEREGIKYKGLSFGNYTHALSQLGAAVTDPKTGEVLFRKDPGFKRFFELLDKYRKIPGMIDTTSYKYSFTKEKNIAMYIWNIQLLPILIDTEGLKFDLVSVPTWPDLPNVGPTGSAISFGINKHSKNKDAAWAALSYLTSEEGQTKMSRNGSPPTIKSQKAIEQYAATQMEKTGKTFSVKPPFMQKYGKVPPFSPYTLTDFNMEKSAADFVKSDKDTDTFLREMEDKYSAQLMEQKGQK